MNAPFDGVSNLVDGLSPVQNCRLLPPVVLSSSCCCRLLGPDPAKVQCQFSLLIQGETFLAEETTHSFTRLGVMSMLEV